jgi:hypothetical protein
MHFQLFGTSDLLPKKPRRKPKKECRLPYEYENSYEFFKDPQSGEEISKIFKSISSFLDKKTK